MSEKIRFDSDYMEGCHPKILEKLSSMNFEKNTGYGLDVHSENARALIRKACGNPDAEIWFLCGGTQTNACVISALLRPYEAVVSASTGHVTAHEAGAIEATGHKVLTLPQYDGKIRAEDVQSCVDAYNNDSSRDHLVKPGMVYISHPTEYGTLYTKTELQELSSVCRKNNLFLFLDGARLGYGLASTGTDVTLSDIAAACDAFYIGGTKVGALFGEAVVFRNNTVAPHFFTHIKQHGALIAKGFVTGAEYETLFTDNLYMEISRNAIEQADFIRAGLAEKGYEFLINSPSNQIFPIVDNKQLAAIEQKATFTIWEPLSDGRTVLRVATSWATTRAQAEALLAAF
ncbi:MAG: aminotransferase class I/II-fold pyridoxal phosphate-dependent enzyme [Treponemataceae bacterium]|nr:aminotransferase class I/II-fold pyridoxal phosphate-dependent enzyme [Treponemataceae bacterium]